VTTLELFKKEVSDRSHIIDPNSELDWYALTLGWALAKGDSVEDAINFACYVRYHTDLG
jgi:hypothetical protein